MSSTLELLNIHKRFGTLEALAGASVIVHAGTVHAVLGENGAGKTTLMRIAYGMMRPDAGAIRVNGVLRTFRSPLDATADGIGMVHQHFSLVPEMTVAENVALGRRGRYKAREAAERVHAVGERTGLRLDPLALVRDLPVGAQQRLEIVKALAREAHVLIFDEPTAVLAPREIDDLLQWIRRFADAGNSAVLITHKLREAIRIADDITVLRRGRAVLTGTAGELNDAQLVRAMLGAALAERHQPTGGSSPSNIVLAAEDVWTDAGRGRVALRGVRLVVRGGEMLGVAAVEGAGQHELLRVLAGRLAPSRGRVVAPAQVAFIPEDRLRDALAPDMSLVENVALKGLAIRRGRMPWSHLRDATTALVREFNVGTPGTVGSTSARQLSGGNQQMLVLARELSGHPLAVIAENPTRGLDVRASATIRDSLRQIRDRGGAVLIYSSDLDEVLALADRIVAVYAGTVRSVEHDREAIGRAMLGAA